MEHDGNFKDKATIAQSAPLKTKPGSINITQQPIDQAAPSLAPLTPRIDISRASSSSYHEDSSPENVFDQVRNCLHKFFLQSSHFLFNSNSIIYCGENT